MEEQNGAAAATFEPGQPVSVADVGDGVIRNQDPDNEGFFIVDLEKEPEEGAGTVYRAAVASLTAITTEAEEEPEEEPESAEAASVFEELGQDYAEATEERRETFPLLPGRFKGRLMVKVKPVDPEVRKKKVRRIAKRGISTETEARYAAELIALATEEILVQLKDGGEHLPAHEISPELGPEPVRFDHRLGKVIPTLGTLLDGTQSEATIVRLLFKNLDALEGFFSDLDRWLKEETPSEDDEDRDRPS